MLTSSTRSPLSANASAVGAGERGLADTALAGEEHEFWQILEHFNSNAGRTAPGLAPQQHFFFGFSRLRFGGPAATG